MSEIAPDAKPGRMDRWRERRRERRQRRAWRRERRKSNPNLYDAHNEAESSNYSKGGYFTTCDGDRK
jgi:hypothetical protein